MEKIEIEITTEYIKLDQLLKFSGVAENGADAKDMILSEEVVLKAGMSIPEIFDRFGEGAFRQFETQVLAEHGMQSGLVIATGGGCVTRRENYRHLHQNGQIIWLKRSLGSLPTDGRPLSMKYKLDEMYRIREPLYADFSDRIIINENTPEDAVSAILRQEEI